MSLCIITGLGLLIPERAEAFLVAAGPKWCGLALTPQPSWNPLVRSRLPLAGASPGLINKASARRFARHFDCVERTKNARNAHPSMELPSASSAVDQASTITTPATALQAQEHARSKSQKHGIVERILRSLAIFCFAMTLLFPSAVVAKGGGGASGGFSGAGGLGRHHHSRPTWMHHNSRTSSMSADVETVGTVLLAGAMVGEAALENLKKRKRAPSSAKRSRLEENRRLWVTTSAPSGPGGSLPPPPPSGVYSAEYSERGCKGRSSYDLQFVDGRVIGKGSDDDGEFVIDGGVYDSLSGRAAWGEWTKSTGLYSEVKLQCGEGTLSGKYKSNLGMAGELELKFFGSVVTPSAGWGLGKVKPKKKPKKLRDST